MACLSQPQSLSLSLRRTTHPGLPRRRVWMLPGVLVSTLVMTPASFAAGVLPQGGQYVGGQGTIAGSGNSLVITQPGSSRGVIDWNSFSIGALNKVTFDNGLGATLNRVTGGSLSMIAGKLSATGSVYLINPQGIVVGPTGVVTTGGRFVASTLDVCNCAFMSGDTLTLSGSNANAVVVNLGKISSSGGDVFLIAQGTVLNAGTVKAPNGTAEFAAGQTVLLQDSSSGQQVFVQTGSKGNILEEGVTRAAQINLQAADGNIYALAGNGQRVRATGTATRDGHIWLVADAGHVTQAGPGAITAMNADGSGGTVDTQAATVSLVDQAAVRASQWNLTTAAFTIDSVAAKALQRSLNDGTAVALTTTGANGATGDLDVASDLKWQSAAPLTLAAYHDVSVAPGVTIANKGAGNLTLRADASGVDNGGSVTNGGTIDWSKSTGAVSLLYDMTGTYTPGALVTNAAWVSPAESGLVTQITSYKLVNSLADYQNVSLDLAGNYALGKDIGVGLGQYVSNTAIGSVATPFTGQFDGMGHTISQFYLYIDYASAPQPYVGAGLFGVIGSSGVVRNLTVDGSISGYGTYGGFGMLAGINFGTIAGSHTTGSINAIGGYSYTMSAGGLVGWNEGLVTRSSSGASVYTEGTPGGLVGTNYASGVIRQSFATGEVSAVAHSGGGGGLVGYNTGLITQSYATGGVVFNPDYCGGVSACTSGGGALVQTNAGTIAQSFATGQVSQQSGPGVGLVPAGIASANTGGTIGTDVFWNTQTTGAAIGVNSGTAVPATQRLTTAQMSVSSSFGPTYDFGANGVWAMPSGATHPVLRWQLAH